MEPAIIAARGGLPRTGPHHHGYAIVRALAGSYMTIQVYRYTELLFDALRPEAS